jgi:prepilin-type processing-associated H-X9-DG protein/prepilin-type N-terminal cleavage/methylation domain-containing protein
MHSPTLLPYSGILPGDEMMAGRKSRAFTLIEILVSAAIIAVLIVMLLPAVKTMTGKAKQASCVNNLRQLSVAFISFRSENQQFFPGQGPAAESTQRWMQKVSPYLGIPESTAANGNIAYSKSIFYCPSVPAAVYRPGSSKAGCGVYGAPRTIVSLGQDLGISFLRVNNPSKKVLLAEKSYLSYQGFGGAGPGLDITLPFPSHADGAAANHRPDGNPRNGPSGACNYLFVDGHVESLSEWPGVDAFNPDK